MDIYNDKPVLKEKRRQGRQPKFTYEYMLTIGKAIVEDGMRYREAAKLFGCSHGLLTSAKKMYLTGQPSKNHIPDEPTLETQVNRQKDQLDKLKQEIGELYLENQMLKKALYLSQQIKKGNSSVITSENLDQYLKDVK